MMRHPAVIGARSSEQVDGIISAMDFRLTPLEIGEIEPTIEMIWGSFFYIVFRNRNTGTINRERAAPMTKQRIFCAALLGLCGALGGATLFLYDYARADVLADRFLLHGRHGILGGNFWDGRVPDLAAQGLQPAINPNEMAKSERLAATFLQE
jgi:hypothetical protein